MIGKTLGHYHITDELTEGEMDVAASAPDTRLVPDAPIKTLLPEWQLAPAWLLKEIRSGQ